MRMPQCRAEIAGGAVPAREGKGRLGTLE